MTRWCYRCEGDLTEDFIFGYTAWNGWQVLCESCAEHYWVILCGGGEVIDYEKLRAKLEEYYV